MDELSFCNTGYFGGEISMLNTTCDRCGKVMDINVLGNLISKHEEHTWWPIVLVNAIDPQTKKARNIDLCQDCEKDLYRFIFGEEVKTWENQ